MCDMPIWKPYSKEGCNCTLKTRIACCVGGVSTPCYLGLVCQIFYDTEAISPLDLSTEMKIEAWVSSDFSSPVFSFTSVFMPHKMNKQVSKTMLQASSVQKVGFC